MHIKLLFSLHRKEIRYNLVKWSKIDEKWKSASIFPTVYLINRFLVCLFDLIQRYSFGRWLMYFLFSPAAHRS